MNLRRRILDAIKSAWGIESPSRAYAEGMRRIAWDRVTFDGAPWPPSPPAPWYSARGPRDAYESPELRAAARRVRRLVRRHWYALFFEPESDVAHEVRIAMATRPHVPNEPTLLDAAVLLQNHGFIPKDEPDLMRDLFARCGITLEAQS